MSIHIRSRMAAALLLGAVTASGLTGCAGTSASAGGSISLADTKSAAQLLFNNAMARIGDEYVSYILERKDVSVPCGDPADDPDELKRSWLSSGTVSIVAAHIHETDVIMQVLADNFEPAGWVAEGDDEVRVLSKGESTITLTVVPFTSQLRIESAGPCVVTAGPESDEVKALEGR